MAVEAQPRHTHLRHRRAEFARRVVQPVAPRNDASWPPPTRAELERIGKALAERLTYLMEPISPIEIDADACVVQLRSNPPQRDDDGRSYYELMVRRGGEIALARYRKENGDARQQIPATVTREVLLRLVGDFCAVLD